MKIFGPSGGENWPPQKQEKIENLPANHVHRTADHFGVSGPEYTDMFFVTNLPTRNEQEDIEYENAKFAFTEKNKYPDSSLIVLFNDSAKEDWKRERGYYGALWKEMRDRHLSSTA